MIETLTMGPVGLVPCNVAPHLTPTERRLLDLLQSRAGEAVTRTEVVARVLDDDLAAERTVDVHVRALRKKLGPAAHIRTIRGAGYAWAGEPPRDSAAGELVLPWPPRNGALPDP